MAVTTKQVESIPATYPAVTPYPHRNEGNFASLEEDAVIDPALIWQRIEAFIAHRWTPRGVVWMVEGAGHWVAPLTPVVTSSVEVWGGAAWVSATPAPSPYGGFDLSGEGPHRVTASVGGGDVPAAVQEAFKRLHEYSRGVAEQFRNDASYRKNGETEVVTNWAAKALQLSGAADLLRPYRRA